MAFKETIKKITKKVLSVGTPPEKDVLYKEVVKNKVPEKSAEAMFIDDIKNNIKKIWVPTQELPSTNTEKTVTKKEDNISKENAKKIEKKVTKKEPKAKKPSTKKTEATKAKKTTVKAKKVATTQGSKKDEKIALYTKDIKKHYGEVDEDFVAIIVKNLGQSIYRKNAELVSCSNPKELDTVRRNFLVKKLGMSESKEVLDAAILDICTELKGVRRKYRATFYYALAKKLKKESALS